MGDHTNAYMSRIKHKMQSSSRLRKNHETVFWAAILVGLALVSGYFLGSRYPYTGQVPSFAEKAGEVRAQRLPPRP